jgi:hypothetical protein
MTLFLGRQQDQQPFHRDVRPKRLCSQDPIRAMQRHADSTVEYTPIRRNRAAKRLQRTHVMERGQLNFG